MLFRIVLNAKPLVAEAIGTFALVFFGTIAVTLSVSVFGSGLTVDSLLFISFAHGAAIALMVYAFMHISGAHINPAVTVAMLVTKRIDVKNGAAYIVFQLIGATVAAFAHKIILPVGSAVNYGVQTGPSNLIGTSMISGIGIEMILTFFLVTVIFMTAVYKKASASISGLSIGGMVFLAHLVGIGLTGASLNPARTFGPALASGFWEFHLIYWIGPIVGAIIAALLMNYMISEKTSGKNRKR